MVQNVGDILLGLKTDRKKYLFTLYHQISRLFTPMQRTLVRCSHEIAKLGQINVKRKLSIFMKLLTNARKITFLVSLKLSSEDERTKIST